VIAIAVIDASLKDCRRTSIHTFSDSGIPGVINSRRWYNSMPARTFPELQAKARAAQIELERDAADCEGPGSFLELSRSLINDLKAMGSAETPLPLVRKADLRVVA
jgi:hypothetical protein